MPKFKDHDPYTGADRTLRTAAEVDAAAEREKAPGDGGPAPRRAGLQMAMFSAIALVIAVAILSWMFGVFGDANRDPSVGQLPGGMEEARKAPAGQATDR